MQHNKRRPPPQNKKKQHFRSKNEKKQPTNNQKHIQKGTDAKGPMREPMQNYQEYWSLFFVFFMLVGCFLLLNLCVGVIIDNFAEMKKSGGPGGRSCYDCVS